MTVKDLGFFRELPHGSPDGPSLREAVAKGDATIQGRIVSYLRRGSILAVTTKDAFDVLSNSKVNAGRLAMMTDGDWLWPADLPYYVEHYNVLLPREFTDHAASSGWHPPQLSPEQLSRVEQEILPE
ncbi:hypothetical protein [Saccharothrix luteola]|uniref:hypothetical protein n=1 Tax=Saccharothrix luteola TaxID=2893018 RepID=UPI001E59C00F|nr:hypothetical protein [Saccharothrix luteola]MCC8247654.1 hypothetical protein [Saccharothrix luteola]